MKDDKIRVSKQNMTFTQTKRADVRKQEPTATQKHIWAQHVEGVWVDTFPADKVKFPLNHPKQVHDQIKAGTRKVSRPLLKQDEVKNRLDVEVSLLRGGHKEEYFSGIDTNDPMQASYTELFESIERIDPQATERYRPKRNVNTKDFMMYDSPPNPKPMERFETRMRSYRMGGMMNKFEQYGRFKQNTLTIPVFKKGRPMDPLANKAYMVKRISYKNPEFLSNFISPGGQILGRRHTGVRGRAQKAIEVEAKKARYLGIFSFTGNPYFTSTKHQPLFKDIPAAYFSESVRVEEDEREDEEISELQLWSRNLNTGHSPTGSIEWVPEHGVGAYDTATAKADTINEEYWGNLPEQLEEKKKLTRRLMLENIILKSLGSEITKVTLNNLTKIVQTNGAGEDTQTSEVSA